MSTYKKISQRKAYQEGTKNNVHHQREFSSFNLTERSITSHSYNAGGGACSQKASFSYSP